MTIKTDEELDGIAMDIYSHVDYGDEPLSREILRQLISDAYEEGYRNGFNYADET